MPITIKISRTATPMRTHIVTSPMAVSPLLKEVARITKPARDMRCSATTDSLSCGWDLRCMRSHGSTATLVQPGAGRGQGKGAESQDGSGRGRSGQVLLVADRLFRHGHHQSDRHTKCSRYRCSLCGASDHKGGLPNRPVNRFGGHRQSRDPTSSLDEVSDHATRLHVPRYCCCAGG